VKKKVKHGVGELSGVEWDSEITLREKKRGAQGEKGRREEKREGEVERADYSLKKNKGALLR